MYNLFLLCLLQIPYSKQNIISKEKLFLTQIYSCKNGFYEQRENLHGKQNIGIVIC